MLKEEIESYISRFAAYLAEVEGKPNTTITAYTGDVRQMAVIFSGIPEIADKRIADLRKPDANAYAKTLADNGMKASTRARKIKAARCFFRWLCEDAEAAPDSVNKAFHMLKAPKIPQVLVIGDAGDQAFLAGQGKRCVGRGHADHPFNFSG